MKSSSIVVSWTAADGDDCAMYCVALYDGKSSAPLDFHFVDDLDANARPSDACEQMIAYIQRANGVANVAVEYDT